MRVPKFIHLFKVEQGRLATLRPIWAQGMIARIVDESRTYQQQWPRIEAAQVIDDGQELAVLVREFDGTISAVRITVDQLAD